MKDKVGGVLVDDDDWVDGSTAAQWPAVVIRDSGSVDVTSDWVRDIATDTIADASHKHPDTTTGLWRDSKGVYNERVEPTTDTDILPLGEYSMEVTYDVNGISFTEAHTINLVASGDVDFGAEILTSVTPSEIKVGIVTSLTDAQLTDIITEAALLTEGELEACGIDTSALGEIPPLVKIAVINASRAIVLRRDLGASQSIESVREGNKTFKFGKGASVENASELYWKLWKKTVDRYCQAQGLGGPRLKTPKKRTWDQVLGNSRFTFGTRNQRNRK